MILRSRYIKLPVSIKLLSPPLLLFLGLWAAGIVGFSYFVNSSMEQTARKETADMALLLQHNLQQKQKFLNLETRWISEEPTVVKAVERSDRTALRSRFLPIQAVLELDLIKIIAADRQTLLSSQQGSLERVRLPDATINSVAQSRLERSGALLAENGAPSSLVSFISIKSPTQPLATLVTGIAFDDRLLQEMRGNTSMHLVAFQGNRVEAATLPLDRNQSWQFPQPNDPLTWIEIAGTTYLVKTVELPGFDQKTLKIAVLNSIQDMEYAEEQMYFAVGSFGFLGAGLFAGVTIIGFRMSQALSRRIQVLTQATQQLAQGDLTLRIPVNDQDELGLLAQGFNKMAEQLTARDQQLNLQMQQLESTLEDLHRTQSQMIQSEKMSALGQMVAGIAHEINNPINFIYGNLPYVEQYAQEILQLLASYQQKASSPDGMLQPGFDPVDLDFLTQDLTKVLQSMRMGSDRIRDIVVSLRNFSRLDETEFKPVDLHEGIDDTLMILAHRLKAGAEFPGAEVVKHYGQLPLVECHAGHLNQVFMNLLANAIDALEDAAAQQIQNNQTVQPGKILISTQVMDNGLVQIMIADNGPGMPESTRSHIFDPFFTTKPIGRGTGLGLSISYQIITQKHHGRIWCDSTPGEGTKFVVEIPVHQLEPSFTYSLTGYSSKAGQNKRGDVSNE